MDESRTALAEPTPLASAGSPRVLHGGGLWFAVALLAVVVLFGIPLAALTRFALRSDLYSYIVIIPLVSGYLAWSGRFALGGHGRPNRRLAATFIVAGLILLAVSASAPLFGAALAREDRMAMSTAAFVITVSGTCGWFLAAHAWRKLLFPLAFLFFMVPVPTALIHHVETFMQHGSAAVAHFLFRLSATPVFYQDLHFQLPGINLLVAPECSGIRSTLVLLIVSVLTGYFFLRTVSGRVMLSAAVIPLALVRNGFRIFTIGELCTYVGPHMIDSPIHHQGGPVFFALSLIPFFLLLYAAVRWEKRRAKRHRPAVT